MDILEVPFEIRALVGKVELPMTGYLALEVGDILVLDQKIGKPFRVTIEEKEQYLGFPGLTEIHKAIKIEVKL